MDKQNQPKQSFFKHFWWVLLVLALLIVAVVILLRKEENIGPEIGPTKESFIPTADDSKKTETNWPSLDAKYITAVPLDLAQIESISKYRSCAGHDRSGYSFEKTLESNRSMKHYFYPVTAYQGTLDKVKMFTPFDGLVAAINLEKDKVGGRPNNGNGISFSNSVDPNVLFQFGHIYFTKEFKVGDKVKAGELIGYAALGEKGFDFDIDLMGAEKVKPDAGMETEVLGSAFDHMSDSVLAEFAKYGITPDNTKVTKEYRDANECNYTASTNTQGRENEDWIQLKQ